MKRESRRSQNAGRVAGTDGLAGRLEGGERETTMTRTERSREVVKRFRSKQLFRCEWELKPSKKVHDDRKDLRKTQETPETRHLWAERGL